MQDVCRFEPVPLTEEKIDLFNRSTFYLYGSILEPIAVAKREVSTAQNRYLSLITPKYTKGPFSYAIIDIYEPKLGRPYVTKIIILDINDV
ncbi:MAG TPA: hypothetical protein GXZ90_10460 [Clostridiales bacterium]|nr:hypothetical protein [Clostridiales bacterium]